MRLQKRAVSNEEFELAYNNPEYKKILHSASKKFYNSLTREEIADCAAHALWRALQSHNDEYKRRFTTSLHIFMVWQCKNALRKTKVQSLETILGDNNAFSEEDQKANRLIVQELLDKLPEKYKKIVYLYFIENYTVEEIGKINNCTKSAVSQNMKRALKKLRELCGVV